MSDRISVERRSANMARIRGKDTSPELRTRKAAHSMGLRFRLHRRDLPGKPDLVFPKYRTAIFVHGCFWHQHAACKRASRPKSNRDYWDRKLKRNVERDAAAINALAASGWHVGVIWECQTTDEAVLVSEIEAILSR
ncbi:DNA mismatch endonuclease Vsr [Mesorhizobium sp. B2-4-14]|uniref:very short patch repair endonuclease n=1 Tax=Mesorhizobium sp. B2-4-14 TaxID=2589935 RepID=UPI00112BA747|nr:DNA mismatch endonuclease Vsr [Mesorhizobium sp. B2-4-14]TPL07588.1 DNA mismatch endonuclease Vsr [Mesorhizobium sp. B2-4-14]